MSLNFCAGQYEDAFLPRRLRNWEVGHRQGRRPRGSESRPPAVEPLADIRGRLLKPVVHPGPAHQSAPFTAWDFPSRISRQTAVDLSKGLISRRFQNSKEVAEDVDLVNEERNNSNTVKEYTPGDFTDEKEKIENPEIEELDLTKIIEPDENLVKTANEIQEFKSEEETIRDQCNTMKNGNGHLQRKRLPIVDPFSGFYYARKMHMDNLLHQPLPDTMGPRDNRRGPGQDLDVKPYSTALNVTGERPLTCVGVKKYSSRLNTIDPNRPATSGGEKGNKSIKQNMTPMDLAICWDFRTADPRDEPKRPKHIDGSNGSLAPAVFSMVHTPVKNPDLHLETGRSNAIFSQNILPHDFEDDRIIPSFEKDMSKNKNKNACEVPKCPQHSIYENSKKHKNDIQENFVGKLERRKSGLNKNECDGIHGCGTESNSSKQSINSKKSNTKRKHIKNAWEENVDGSKINNKKINDKSSEKHGTRERAGSLDHLNNNSDTTIRSLNDKNKMCRSSPNIHKDSHQFKDDILSPCSDICPRNDKKQKLRNCPACKENKKKTSNTLTKQEYKAAFKAGNPNSVSSDSKNEYSSNSTKNSVKIPKMRDPFSKKSFAIPTLHPPFNRWNDTSGYPEHWRLASVYQHAYKPPGPKRRPLLPGVYQ